jgi:hypothetical protein
MFNGQTALQSLSRQVIDLTASAPDPNIQTSRLHEVYRAELVRREWVTRGGSFRVQMLAAGRQWEADRQMQRGGVETPHALEKKYPRVGHSWGWFWMFPSPTLSIDPGSGVERRHHLYED